MNSEEYIKEELFCLNLELQSLSGILLKGEAERLVPNYTQPRMEHDHMLRYEFAAEYVKNKNVLDIACGTGYGSKFLATKGEAKNIIGGDISELSIRYAQHRYAHDKIFFSVQDVQNISIPHPMDVIVSFETIEHVPDHVEMLNSVNKNLADGGLFLVSTPISDQDIDMKPLNPYHRIEWGFERFQDEISQKFDITDVYIQLFQNAFLNEKILEEYEKKRSRLNFLQRIQSRFDKIVNSKYDSPQLFLDWNHPRNFSKIEKYVGQYAISDIGTKYVGYQIIVCKKK